MSRITITIGNRRTINQTEKRTYGSLGVGFKLGVKFFGDDVLYSVVGRIVVEVTFVNVLVGVVVGFDEVEELLLILFVGSRVVLVSFTTMSVLLVGLSSTSVVGS